MALARHAASHDPAGRGPPAPLIPGGDAELRRRLGADDQRVVWLERHQQLVVLRARVRVARLLPVDEVERELGVRHPLAWPVLGARGDRLAVDVLLLGELGVEDLDLAGAGEEAASRVAAADRIADLPGLLALELGTVEDPVTVGEEGPAGDDPADLHASLRLGSGPQVAGDDDRLLLALGVIGRLVPDGPVGVHDQRGLERGRVLLVSRALLVDPDRAPQSLSSPLR